MRWLIRWAYPSDWRRRYGAELEQLVEDAGSRPGDVLDLLGAGFALRARSWIGRIEGGHDMTFGPAARHPGMWALAGAVVLAPTALFIGGSLLAYGIGLSSARTLMDPLGAALDGFPLLDAALVLAPPLALLTALLPLLRLERGSPGGAGGLQLVVRLRAANLVVIAVALALVATLAWYFVWEVALGLGS